MKLNSKILIPLFSILIFLPNSLIANNELAERGDLATSDEIILNEVNGGLSEKQQQIIAIAALTAKGDLANLKIELVKGLDASLTVNQIKEAIIHAYAYCGFPRSIRGLQTFMEVLETRKAQGIIDVLGDEASPINDDRSRYERGKEILGELTGLPQTGPRTGYSAFAPQIEIFLKEHLFADLFERDVLTYAERELVTISVIASIGNAEPMLQSHLYICLQLGLSPAQLQQFADIINSKVGGTEANSAQQVLNNVISELNYIPSEIKNDQSERKSEIFPQGELIENNFTGNAWHTRLVTDRDNFNTTVGNVVFEPKARTNWHSHPGGQLLLCTRGKGYYQEKGKPIQLLNVGDVVAILPDVVHWHGAAPDSEFEHIAISPQLDKGSVVWLEPVTDEIYNK
ncbi:MAG: carboxymuconolactone decarboxylase family protein [Fermentimonas sp.]|nr:carboxymuconolactone decarboxylase family protein [Fermentimonas sp.]